VIVTVGEPSSVASICTPVIAPRASRSLTFASAQLSTSSSRSNSGRNPTCSYVCHCRRVSLPPTTITARSGVRVAI
jgi:hypothetical protein